MPGDVTKLCLLLKVIPSLLVDVLRALRRRSGVAADELNLYRCLEGLAVMVAKHHNEAE
ncbi:hypothetical protein LTR74_018509, partial [Friedmanniomyces endolithicus]